MIAAVNYFQSFVFCLLTDGIQVTYVYTINNGDEQMARHSTTREKLNYIACIIGYWATMGFLAWFTFAAIYAGRV